MKKLILTDDKHFYINEKGGKYSIYHVDDIYEFTYGNFYINYNKKEDALTITRTETAGCYDDFGRFHGYEYTQKICHYAFLEDIIDVDDYDWFKKPFRDKEEIQNPEELIELIKTLIE